MDFWDLDLLFSANYFVVPVPDLISFSKTSISTKHRKKPPDGFWISFFLGFRFFKIPTDEQKKAEIPTKIDISG